MYYRSVNRGILTTVPGRYTIALVFALGLIAIASGYNGIYLSLSLGISVLIISGLLSERVMQHFEVNGASRTSADAGQPFSLELKVHNRDTSQILYGVECLVFDQSPRFPLLGKSSVPRMRAQCLILEPRESLPLTGTCEGLPRGYYDHLFVVQRTLYPFGLLSKFKVARLTTDVSILPVRDDALFQRLTREFQHRMARSDAEREFYSHRHHTPLDPSRLIDWRRSAGRPTSEWVVKIFESRSHEQRMRVVAEPGFLRLSPSAEVYERRLAELRTCVDVAHHSERPFELEVQGARVAADREEAFRFLAWCPKFEAVKEMRVIGQPVSPRRDRELRLELSGSGNVGWESGGGQR